jgi:hypothetical protein
MTPNRRGIRFDENFAAVTLHQNKGAEQRKPTIAQAIATRSADRLAAVQNRVPVPPVVCLLRPTEWQELFSNRVEIFDTAMDIRSDDRITTDSNLGLFLSLKSA